MNPNSALSAGQLAIMAVVVAASLAAWLIVVFLAARQPHNRFANTNAGPGEGDATTTAARPSSGARQPDQVDKTAA